MRIVSNYNHGNFFPLSKLDRFVAGDILYFFDVFDFEVVDDIIEKHGSPRYVVNDSFTSGASKNFCLHAVDLWIEQFITTFENFKLVKDFETIVPANFIINKKQINRFLLLKFVEMFELKCSYTWSGIGVNFDLSKVLEDIPKLGLDQKQLRSFFSPVSTKANWINYPKQIYKESNVSPCGPQWVWNHGLDHMFLSSAISLITEPVRHQKAMHFSEKTVYAMLGLTMPIWVGGYAQAQEWKKLGFDVFDDIIDHSYQFAETLIERCYLAIKLNLKVLTDLDLVSSLRYKVKNRLLANQQLIMSDHISKQNNISMSQWPDDLKGMMPAIINIFRQANNQNSINTL